MSNIKNLKTEIWGREFNLPIIIKQFIDKEITDVQNKALECFMNNMDIVDEAKKNVEEYIINNGLSETGMNAVDNIFKYVMPKSVYVPMNKKRVIAIMCNYKFDMEHGIAIIFEEEKFKTVGPQDLIL